IKEKPIPKVETTPVVDKPKGTPPSPPLKTPATEPQLPPKDRERRVSISLNSDSLVIITSDICNIRTTNLMKLPSDYKDSFVEKHGVKLRLMSGFVKAAISTLQKQPILNVVIECIFCECYSWFFS
ncbi:dihydrolipoyllysine-residue succinyltransferase component of 2-oxoglutarate dehydrogenase complex, partial [Striga asiatica]